MAYVRIRTQRERLLGLRVLALRQLEDIGGLVYPAALALSANGDPLETIKKIVRWADFCADIEAVTETQPEERKSNAGRKPYDTILKFKIPMLVTPGPGPASLADLP